MAKKDKETTRRQRREAKKRSAAAGRKNLRKWKEENPEAAKLANLRHGIYSKTIHKRYSDLRTRDGKELQAIMKAIEKDIGKPFDARQSLLMSLIRSKVIIIMQIGKYLESQESIVDYDKGSVAHVVDKTFFHASKSLRSALNELYATGNGKNRGKKTYEEIVSEMEKTAARVPSLEPEGEERPPTR